MPSVMAMAEKLKLMCQVSRLTVQLFLDGDHFTVCNEVTGAGDLPPTLCETSTSSPPAVLTSPSAIRSL